MSDNTIDETKTLKALSDLGFDPTGILCKFRFDNYDCLAVKIAEEVDNAKKCNAQNCNPLTEICRFTVNGCKCAIIKKALNQEFDELNLSVVLTPRELQIATLVALGCPNKQVADKLHISEWTVATYLRRIFAKLGVETRAAMTYRCASLICRQDVALSK